MTDALCNQGLRRALAVAHLAIDDSDLAWRGLMSWKPVSVSFVERVYDAGATRASGAVYDPGTASWVSRAVAAGDGDDRRYLRSARYPDISQPPSDAMGWAGWLLNLVVESAHAEVVPLLELVADGTYRERTGTTSSSSRLGRTWRLLL